MEETMEKMNILKRKLKSLIEKLQILLIYLIINITILLYVLKKYLLYNDLKLLEISSSIIGSQ